MGGHKVDQNRNVYFAMSVPTMIKGTCALPLFALFFTVVWSLIFDFEASTRTHCKVWNLLPTISAAIGGFTPQRYVWRVCVALHASQRLMVAAAYCTFHSSVALASHSALYRALCRLVSLLSLAEVLSLVGLSMISSSESSMLHENLFISFVALLHENLFISFVACGLLYMLLSIVLMRWGRCGPQHTPTAQELTSLRYKTRLFVFKLVAFSISVYMYFRHNAYCEPGENDN
ncbi:hypothetical protein ACOMHN_031243 [Nucella lapillus]